MTEERSGIHSEAPAPGDSAEGRLESILDSLAQKLRRGERLPLEEVTRQHPDLAERLRELLPGLGLLGELVTRSPTSAHTPALESGALDASSPLPPALRCIGEFQLIRELGRGGMGVVYEAREEGLERPVALKILPMHSLLDPRSKERFRREAQMVAGLHHSSIVPVLRFGEVEGICYIAMQRIDGEGLDQVILDLRRLAGREPGDVSTSSAAISGLRGLAGASLAAGAQAMPPGPEVSLPPDYYRTAARWIVEAAHALAYAHEEGVLHRDIKPSNLLLDSNGRIWLTDFGLAKEESAESLTLSGEILGTLRYMPPERLIGRSDARGDIYSMGLTLYELITLQPAFEAADRELLIRIIACEEPPWPQQVNQSVPRDLEVIVLKSISKAPELRYSTALEMAADLERFIRGAPIIARLRRRDRLRRLWRRRRGRIVSALLVAAALIGSAAYFFSQGSPAGPMDLEIVDLNGDGRPDLLVTHAGTEGAMGSTISATLNEGPDGFSKPKEFLTGLLPVYVATGDLNEDGRLDAAVLSMQPPAISIHVNSGDGSFRKLPEVLAVSDAKLWTLTCGDLDGDRRPDLAATAGENSIAIFKNDGDGGFREAVLMETGPFPNFIVAGDLNGDARLDLVTSNGAQATRKNISVHLNGDVRGFLPPDHHDLGEPTYSILLADFNGDGFSDLAVALRSGIQFVIFRNLGDGRFAEPSWFQCPAVQALAAGDLDGDGDLDLAGAGGEDQTTVFLNDGRADFTRHVGVTGARNPTGIQAADLDGDGDLDLAVLNYGSCDVVVLENQGMAQFAASKTIRLTPRRWERTLFGVE